MATKTPTTTQFVDIADIHDMLVLLKDGSLRAIVEVESVNFDLKSNDEQIAIIRGFQDFLNALDFPLQIVVSSRKLDITAYLAIVDEVAGKQTNELLKVQTNEYARFIKGLSELANIMTKRFYVVIPYHTVEAAAQTNTSVKDRFKSLFGTTKNATALTDEDVQKYRSHLEQRMSVIMAGLNPLGLQTRILSQAELSPLYYEYYNPGQKIN